MNCEGGKSNAVLDCELMRGCQIGPLNLTSLVVFLWSSSFREQILRAIWEALNPNEFWICGIHYKKHLEGRPKH